MNRVKFYSKRDLSIYSYLDRLEEVITTVKIENEYYLIDILEFYNVSKFLDSNIYPDIYSTEEIVETKKLLNTISGRFFNSRIKSDIFDDFNYLFLSSNDTPEEKDYIRIQYRDDYIVCFEKYDFVSKISESDLTRVIQDLGIPINIFLNTNYFVSKYECLFKELFLENSLNFELLLNNYTLENNHMFIPSTITKNEMYDLAEKYIQNPFVNSKYLTLIEQNIQGLKELVIDAKLKPESFIDFYTGTFLSKN